MSQLIIFRLNNIDDKVWTMERNVLLNTNGKLKKIYFEQDCNRVIIIDSGLISREDMDIVNHYLKNIITEYNQAIIQILEFLLGITFVLEDEQSDDTFGSLCSTDTEEYLKRYLESDEDD